MRFKRIYRIGKYFINVNLSIWDKDKDLFIGIDSGAPFKEPQYLILDYDDVYPEKEAPEIIKAFSLKRGLIVQTSNERYQLISFSPMKISSILEIMFFADIDREFAVNMMRFGKVSSRLNAKDGSVPRIIKEIDNEKGTNFYNWNMERWYREMIGEEATFSKPPPDGQGHQYRKTSTKKQPPPTRRKGEEANV